MGGGTICYVKNSIPMTNSLAYSKTDNKDLEAKKPERQKRQPANFLEVLIQQRKAKARLQNQAMLARQQEDTSTGHRANTPVKVKVLRMEQLARTKEVQPTPRTPAKRKRGSGVRAGNPPPKANLNKLG